MTYIEREALLAKRQTVGICDAAGNYYGAADVVFLDDIEAIPATDVVPVKHGKWMPKPVMIRCLYAKNHYCSECKSENEATCNYCPNCGAKMREN